jgi:hypothetical protein
MKFATEVRVAQMPYIRRFRPFLPGAESQGWQLAEVLRDWYAYVSALNPKATTKKRAT